ncbi:hypothetical protein HPB49_016617 [Dermacentor silvarum]|uniref:Uncharacterized protein n=1 Tax=Dermacentor silvarum TaxID=543639 RepID=A0ACB8CAH2_DERSI|nr:hypothetical protein HPB49_016617 [Dermacentor silvarum]
MQALTGCSFQGSGVKKAHKMARLDPGLFQTVSQLLQAGEPKSKKPRKAKSSLHSAALDRASSLDELRQRLSHKIEALRGEEITLVVAIVNKKAEKTPQAAPVFNRDSHMVYSKFELAGSAAGTDARPKVEKKKLVHQLEVKAEKMKNLEELDPERAKKAQEKQKWHRALDRAEGIKVRDDPELLKATLKRHEKRRQQSRKKWESRTEHVKQRQEERQQKRRDNIKARKQAKLQTKMKRLKKKGHIVPGF